MTDSYASTVELLDLVANVNTAAKKFEIAADGDVHVARRNLQHETRKLLYSLEEPNIEVWPRTFQVNVCAAVEIVSQLGIWNKFERGKTVSLAEIEETTQADEIMIIRIFRHLTAAGIFADIPGPSFVLTTAGQPYLNTDHQAFNSFMFNEVTPSIIAMPRTLVEHVYKAPTKESGTPYMWANGEELWTWLGSHPDRALNMVAGMKSLNTEELAKLDFKDDDVVVVNIAGGQGHIVEEIRKRNPHIKARFIVQDLPSTFKAVSGPPPGVGFMAYDTFTPQPSLFVTTCAITEGVTKKQTATSGFGLPDPNVTMQESIRDISMYAIGGLERNHGQWKELLAKNGLKIKKIWRGSEPEACVECELL